MEYKSVEATLDYLQDWSSWLSTGDTIASSSWVAESPLTVDSEANTTTTATAVISGGLVGGRYKVTNSIVTANGLDESFTWFLTVQERIV